MSSIQTLYDILAAHARQTPAAAAILAPERSPLTYEGLHLHLTHIIKQLNGLGLSRNDRVAIVLPNGPEMATAFLAVMSCATAAPLNPAYRANEFEFYLRDLKAKAVITQTGMASAVLGVAQALDLPLIELVPKLDAPAGIFTLVNQNDPLPDAQPISAQPQDVALMLHTSGTTAKPKLVPLTQSYLSTSTRNIQTTFNIDSYDRCLNVMPLFHAHGLIIGLILSLGAGAAVICPPKFEAAQFFKWLETFRPTWYSAAPTIHQSIIEYSGLHPELDINSSLRFIRSSAAPLSPHLLAQLENTFNTPVIEGYGMTEAIQIASNPLPPKQRKAGSVGHAAGPEVAIMDEAGHLLSAGSPGEIVIRGVDMVMEGYQDNPEINGAAFSNGWFKTGDQGYLDAKGYLFINGRLKEVINRGGEKVAPREVDEVLLEHPNVAQAVTFAVPHPTLGEDVAAAVVLREPGATTEKELRDFAFSRLIDFKVPSQVIVVDALPKGPTGKLKRLELAQLFAAQLKVPFVAPTTPLEVKLAQLWMEVLDLERVGIYDNFFALGGDSITGTRFITRARHLFQPTLPLSSLFKAPTIAEFTQLIQVEKLDSLSPESSIKPLARDAYQIRPHRREKFEQGQINANQSLIRTNDKPADKAMDFSLFFFSADGSDTSQNKYRLFLDTVKFADQHGFSAIWTPERHFHPFGGLYPNPAVLGAAVATMTDQIQIRAGSVVLPFQDPLRVAEEWSVIDNLSGGRAAIACASGWHVNDFVLAPANYDRRKEIMFERIEIIQRLWRGESIRLPNGAGVETEVRIFPQPLQPMLPIWLASHSDTTFIKAGEMGVNILTTIWNTDIETIARQIGLYRQSLAQHGRDPATGKVTLMLHTFVGETMEVVRQKVKSAYEAYLYINLGLQEDLVTGVKAQFDLTEEDKGFIVSKATEQLFRTRGLIGTPEICVEKLKALQAIGVDEVACLIDFGIDFDSTLASLQQLKELKDIYNQENTGMVIQEVLS